MRRPAHFNLLLSILLVGQVACSRPSQSNGLAPTPSPSPDQAAIVDQILARYTEAVGGQAAIERVKSYHAKGFCVACKYLIDNGSLIRRGRRCRRQSVRLAGPGASDLPDEKNR